MSELTKFRVAKDEYFATEHSPLTPEQRRTFQGLLYYSERADLALRLLAQPYEDQAKVEMQTSSGDFAPYTRWGSVSFDIDGEPAKLTLYRDEAGRFFLPFQDVNAGREA